MKYDAQVVGRMQFPRRASHFFAAILCISTTVVLSTTTCGTDGTVSAGWPIVNGSFPFALESGDGSSYGDCFGQAVTVLGDLNGDGVDDIAVGAPYDDDGGADSGAVYVVFLRSDGTVASATKLSNSEGNLPMNLDAGDYFGVSLAFLGDFRGDGIPALAVGAYLDDSGNTDSGAVYILFLNNTDGTVLSRTKISNNVGNFPDTLGYDDRFGFSVTSVGDLNGDGVTDIAVGAPRDDDSGEWSGAVYIIFMTAAGAVDSAQKVSNSHGGFPHTLIPHDQFGAWITSLGDMNGDGVTAIAVGAWYDSDGAYHSGAAYVIFLATDGMVISAQKLSNDHGSIPFVLWAYVYFGSGLAALGDLNMDGTVDLAVAAIYDNDGDVQSGAVYVLFMNSDGSVLSAQKLSNSDGNLPFTLARESKFGISIALLGDFNGDGSSFIVVGAQQGPVGPGEVYILELAAAFCPSAVPSPMPTLLPSLAPSQIPTPMPTRETAMTIAPDVLEISTTKPRSASDVTFLVNLNEHHMVGTIHAVATQPLNSVSVSPSSFVIAPGKYERVTVSTNSTGLHADDYSTMLIVTASTAKSLPINQTALVTVKINAVADPSTTRVVIAGTTGPTLGVPWDKLRVQPLDSDGFSITMNQAGEDLNAELCSGDLAASCTFRWVETEYVSDCFVPDTSMAGRWNLTVSLNGEIFHSTTVRVQCAKGDYEDPDSGECIECPRGTTCPAGTTLVTLPLDEGYWRSGEYRTPHCAATVSIDVLARVERVYSCNVKQCTSVQVQFGRLPRREKPEPMRRSKKQRRRRVCYELLRVRLHWPFLRGM